MHLKGCLRQADIQDILRRRHAWHHILDNTYINSIVRRQPSSHHARLRAFTFCDGHVPHPHHRASPDPTYHVFGTFGCSKRPIVRHIHHLNTVTALGTSVSASVSTYPTGCWHDRCRCFTASSISAITSISRSGRCQIGQSRHLIQPSVSCPLLGSTDFRKVAVSCRHSRTTTFLLNNADGTFELKVLACSHAIVQKMISLR